MAFVELTKLYINAGVCIENVSTTPIDVFMRHCILDISFRRRYEESPLEMLLSSPQLRLFT